MITQTVPATYTFLPVGPISPVAKSRELHRRHEPSNLNELRALRQLCARYTELFAVNIVFAGTSAYASGNTIVLPQITNYSPLQTRLYAGFIAHETAHLKFSDNAAFAQISVIDLQLFVNTLEDSRVEKLMIDHYPEVYEHLMLFNQSFYCQYLQQLPFSYRYHKLPLVWSYLLFLGHDLLLHYPWSGALRQLYYQELSTLLNQESLDYLTDITCTYLPQCTSTADVIALGSELKAILQEPLALVPDFSRFALHQQLTSSFDLQNCAELAAQYGQHFESPVLNPRPRDQQVQDFSVLQQAVAQVHTTLSQRSYTPVDQLSFWEQIILQAKFNPWQHCPELSNFNHAQLPDALQTTGIELSLQQYELIKHYVQLHNHPQSALQQRQSAELQRRRAILQEQQLLNPLSSDPFPSLNPHAYCYDANGQIMPCDQALLTLSAQYSYSNFLQGLSTQVKQHLRYYQEFAAGPNTKGTKSTTVLHLSSLEPYGSTATVKYSSVLGTLAGLDSEHMLALLEHCRERQFLSTQQQQTLEEWLRELSNLSLSDLVFDEQQRTKSLSHLATSISPEPTIAQNYQKAYHWKRCLCEELDTNRMDPRLENDYQDALCNALTPLYPCPISKTMAQTDAESTAIGNNVSGIGSCTSNGAYANATTAMAPAQVQTTRLAQHAPHHKQGISLRAQFNSTNLALTALLYPELGTDLFVPQSLTVPHKTSKSAKTSHQGDLDEDKAQQQAQLRDWAKDSTECQQQVRQMIQRYTERHHATVPAGSKHTASSVYAVTAEEIANYPLFPLAETANTIQYPAVHNALPAAIDGASLLEFTAPAPAQSAVPAQPAPKTALFLPEMVAPCHTALHLLVDLSNTATPQDTALACRSALVQALSSENIAWINTQVFYSVAAPKGSGSYDPILLPIVTTTTKASNVITDFWQKPHQPYSIHHVLWQGVQSFIAQRSSRQVMLLFTTQGITQPSATRHLLDLIEALHIELFTIGCSESTTVWRHFSPHYYALNNDRDFSTILTNLNQELWA